MILRIAWLILVASAMSLSAAFQNTNAPVQDLGNGTFKLGLVTIDSNQKTVTFPATVNMTSGTVEYLVVTTGGKVHESLLATAVEPIHLHAAMLLLGATNATNLDAAVFFDAKRELPGTRIRVEVEATNAPAGQKAVPIHTLLQFAESQKPVSAEAVPYWIYNGSRFSEHPGREPVAAGAPPRATEETPPEKPVFMAQREGSIVSLIADPSALVNNPRKDRENDELWTLRTQAIPPQGTPVKVIFRLAPKQPRPSPATEPNP